MPGLLPEPLPKKAIGVACSTEAAIASKIGLYPKAPKLSEELKLEVCRRIASFMTINDIHTWLCTEHHIDLEVQSIYAYRAATKWKPVIERMRAEYIAGVMETPIAHKRVRLDRLESQYQALSRDSSLSPAERRKEERAILNDARLEVDDPKTNISNLYLTQITHSSDAELLARKQQLMERLSALGVRHAVRSQQGPQAPDTLLDAELRGGGLCERSVGEGDGEDAPEPEPTPGPVAPPEAASDQETAGPVSPV